MTDAQMKFLEVSKRYEALKKEMKELKPVMQDLLTEIGIGSHFQDPATKAVYQVVEPNGTFITFDRISYDRTRLEGEAKGSLSMKKAEELGYELK